MTDRRHHRTAGKSGAETLDTVVPLVGVGFAAYLAGRAARRRGEQASGNAHPPVGQITDVSHAAPPALGQQASGNAHPPVGQMPDVSRAAPPALGQQASGNAHPPVGRITDVSHAAPPALGQQATGNAHPPVGQITDVSRAAPPALGQQAGGNVYSREGQITEEFDQVLEQIAATVAATRPKSKLSWTKKFLVLAMMIGIISFVVGGSTFGSFSAEISNPGNTFASGTLTLSDQVNSGTVCNSFDATSLDNYKATCSAILALTNEAPGVTDTSGSYVGGYAKVTIQNTGSLNASLFSLFAPWVNARINTQINSGATVGTGQTVTSFTVTPLEGPVSTNDKIYLSTSGTTQQFCAGAAAAAGATSITISGGYAVGSSGSCPASTTTAGTGFNVGTRMWDASSNSSVSTTDCFDAQTTSSPVGGATYGTQLNFNSTTNNPLCSTTLLWVQEQSTYGASTYNYCWFGRGSSLSTEGGSAEDSNGQCRTPTTLVLGSNVTAGSSSYSLNVGTLSGNIRSGDTITFTEGGNTMTCTAAATYSFGYASTISVNTCSGGGAQVFDGSALVKDTTAFTALNATNTSSTISYFDQHDLTGSAIFMPPLTANGTTNATATVQLAKYGTAGSSGVAPSTRVFYVGVYIPAPSNTTQNTLQGLVSTFGLTWHIDQ